MTPPPQKKRFIVSSSHNLEQRGFTEMFYFSSITSINCVDFGLYSFKLIFNFFRRS